MIPSGSFLGFTILSPFLIGGQVVQKHSPEILCRGPGVDANADKSRMKVAMVGACGKDQGQVSQVFQLTSADSNAVMVVREMDP